MERIEPKLYFKRRSTGFTILNNYILAHPDFTCQEKMLHILLCMHAGQDSKCWVFQSTLAKEMGINERQVRRILKQLENKKLIAHQRRGLNRSNVYYINEKPHKEKPKERPIREGQDKNVLSRADTDVRSFKNTFGKKTIPVKKLREIKNQKIHDEAVEKGKRDLLEKKAEKSEATFQKSEISSFARVMAEAMEFRKKQLANAGKPKQPATP